MNKRRIYRWKKEKKDELIDEKNKRGMIRWLKKIRTCQETEIPEY